MMMSGAIGLYSYEQQNSGIKQQPPIQTEALKTE